ncbi:hypothetical protein B0H16DRAFT_1790148 [Mycena metata]|uniref:F-box domain-containing protein n=1 Tax=Mycena metata TaxID=1033252 RepID=A0AAD7HJ49_9AGAR|nr:hypothetical protein B0H16DRAFT_1790148 [Mycena metata]
MTLVVPNDILDGILQCMPTFQSLFAAIRVSKTLYAVFQTRPKSIMRAVAENMVGPALPDAVRVLRYSADSTTTGSQEELDQLTNKEYRRFSTNAAVVKGLEVAFSFKYRDPFSKGSQLTWTESLRFARAVYRIMLYCEVFHISDDEDVFWELQEEEDRYDEVITQRVAMFKKYPTTELLELDAVLMFFRKIAIEFGGDFPTEKYRENNDTLISTGPAAVLDAWESKRRDSMIMALENALWMSGNYARLSDFFTRPLKQIWKDRDVSPPSSNAKRLFDEAPYQSPPCDRCGLDNRYKLRCEQDWAGLHLNIFNLFPDFFPGKHFQNLPEMELFQETVSRLDKHKLISEIFAVKTVSFKKWMPSHALCDACLLKFLTCHRHLWLPELKAKVGDVPKADAY